MQTLQAKTGLHSQTEPQLIGIAAVPALETNIGVIYDSLLTAALPNDKPPNQTERTLLAMEPLKPKLW